MSCRGHGSREDENCVCAVLTAIVEAQDQVAPVDEDDNCDVSCDKSIQALLGEAVTPVNGPNTIPVILYCDCAPFQGFGVKKVHGTFECFQSFVFRVNSVDDNCCASLELLETVKGGKSGGSYPPHPPLVDSVCDQFPATGFKGTGICITVDLACFCGVTCLEPVRL